MRRFRSLVAGLPRDSATARALDPLGGHWHVETELAAQVVDHLAVLNANFVKANSKPGASVRTPQPVPRPDIVEDAEVAEAPRKRMATPQELRAFFGGSVRYTPRAEAPERSN